jgi:hypothetical protein
MKVKYLISKKITYEIVRITYGDGYVTSDDIGETGNQAMAEKVATAMAKDDGGIVEYDGR